MTENYKWIWIVLIALIPVFPLSGLLYGVDVSDVGLSINQYRFCFEDIGSVYLPILLTEVIGAAFFVVFDWLHIPTYLGTEIIWVLAVYYMCYLSYRIYRKYRNDCLVLPALALAVLFAKCNFHYFIYATGVAVMALTALYFLILAVNDEKPWMLAVSVFFMVMACLCKISSLLQFGVFAVLFYDLYQKKNSAYFWRQILWCVIGFAAGLAYAAALIAGTCGFEKYGEMLIEMFLYAGNSQDGHTIGNMVMANVKGALRGMLLLAALAAVAFAAKKFPRAERALRCGIPAAVVLLLLGKLFGLDRVIGFSVLYGVVFDYLNALAVVVALIYVCVILILRSETYPQEFKNLALCAGVLTVLMPIGSNTGIPHICNEIFFALPFIAIVVGDALRKSEFFAGRKAATGAVGAAGNAAADGTSWAAGTAAAGGTSWAARLPGVGVQLTLFAVVWCVGLTAWQSLYLTRARYTTTDEVKAFSLEELRFMSYEAAVVDELEEITAHLRQYDDGERRLIVGGAAPILNYLSGMPPYNEGCGGWIETEFITYEKIEQQLAEVVDYPIVVMCKTAVEQEHPKVALVSAFIEEHPYKLVYQTAEYSVYIPDEESSDRISGTE